MEYEQNKQISDEGDSTLQINKKDDSTNTTSKTSEEDSSEPLKDMMPAETVMSGNAQISLNNSDDSNNSD